MSVAYFFLFGIRFWVSYREDRLLSSESTFKKNEYKKYEALLFLILILEATLKLWWIWLIISFIWEIPWYMIYYILNVGIEFNSSLCNFQSHKTHCFSPVFRVSPFIQKKYHASAKGILLCLEDSGMYIANIIYILIHIHLSLLPYKAPQVPF